MEMICSLVTVRLGLNLEQPESPELAGWCRTSHIKPRETGEGESHTGRPSHPGSGSSQLCELGPIVCLF